jgi:hypothetical protein
MRSALSRVSSSWGRVCATAVSGDSSATTTTAAAPAVTSQDVRGAPVRWASPVRTQSPGMLAAAALVGALVL